MVSRLIRVVRRHDIDLLVSHDYKANLFGYLAARRCRVAQIAHFRGRTAEDTKVKLYNYIDWKTLRRIPLILVVSAPSKELLVKHDIPAERIEVVFNAIECRPLEEVPAKGRPGRPLQVVAAGRLSREKGHDVLLRAVAGIKDDAPPFEVSLYGHGPEEVNIRRMIAELGLQSVVRLCGFVDDIKPVFREADLMVLPSRSEGMPNVILEAWSQGLGVLSTAVGGVPDMIVDSDSGLLASPDDPVALGEKLLAALADPGRLQQFGERGYEIVREQYNYERQAELLTSIYGRYLESRGGTISRSEV